MTKSADAAAVASTEAAESAVAVAAVENAAPLFEATAAEGMSRIRLFNKN